MKTQPERTRDYYMAMARQVRTVQRTADYVDYGYAIWNHKPVSHYVMQARRANRQVVLSKMWRNGRV